MSFPEPHDFSLPRGQLAGTLEVCVKLTFKRRIRREETPLNVKSTQTMTDI